MMAKQGRNRRHNSFDHLELHYCSALPPGSVSKSPSSNCEKPAIRPYDGPPSPSLFHCPAVSSASAVSSYGSTAAAVSVITHHGCRPVGCFRLPRNERARCHMYYCILSAGPKSRPAYRASQPARCFTRGVLSSFVPHRPRVGGTLTGGWHQTVLGWRNVKNDSMRLAFLIRGRPESVGSQYAARSLPTDVDVGRGKQWHTLNHGHPADSRGAAAVNSQGLTPLG